MSDAEKQAKQEVKEIMAVTAKNAVIDMKIAISLSITKDGKYTGVIAEQYLEKMYAFKDGCSDSTKQTWCNAVYNVLCLVENNDVEEVEAVLNCYEEAGVLIGRLREESVLDVARDYCEKNLDENTKVFVELLIRGYSDKGYEFEKAIRDIERENKKGICDADLAMDSIMTKIENNELKKVTEPYSVKRFEPTD